MRLIGALFGKWMTNIRAFTFLVLAICAASNGCRSPFGRPNAKWVEDFGRTDTIQLHSKEGSRQITDSDTVSRFRDIYLNATWKTYWHTLPGNLGDRSIDLYHGDNRLRHFSYTGTLWEIESDKVRTAELTSVDREWIESLFEAESMAASNTPDNNPMRPSGEVGRIQMGGLSPSA
jgi:hypothetical protein